MTEPTAPRDPTPHGETAEQYAARMLEEGFTPCDVPCQGTPVWAKIQQPVDPGPHTFDLSGREIAIRPGVIVKVNHMTRGPMSIMVSRTPPEAYLDPQVPEGMRPVLFSLAAALYDIDTQDVELAAMSGQMGTSRWMCDATQPDGTVVSEPWRPHGTAPAPPMVHIPADRREEAFAKSADRQRAAAARRRR
jgi:hypothetical protein